MVLRLLIQLVEPKHKDMIIRKKKQTQITKLEELILDPNSK